MSWCPFATRRTLPENSTQAAIVPTQFIMHSIAAPWTERRVYEYWRDSTSLESHFGLGYAGDLGQYISTQVRADANAQANRRAVSIETASNLEHTDPWTPQQLEMLVRLGVWLHHEHGIPLRICRTWDDPGYGYHELFPEWSVSGTACPGAARVKQFREYVFPEIVRRAQGGGPSEPEQPDREKEDEIVPIMLEKGKVGDESAFTFSIPEGLYRLNVSANYCGTAGSVDLRFDVMNINGTLRRGNIVWDNFVNGQWGFLEVEGPATVGLQRLNNPWSHVSVTLERR